MTYQSPIAPGISWYEATLGERPDYPALTATRLPTWRSSAAASPGCRRRLSSGEAGGKDVVLIEGARFGDGASGRNGGQMGTGQRAWPEERRPISAASGQGAVCRGRGAKMHLLDFAATHDIDADYRPGQISVAHKKRYVKDYREHVRDHGGGIFGYPHISFMEREETCRAGRLDALSRRHRDTGTGHINPLKYVVGRRGRRQRRGAAAREHAGHGRSPVTAAR
jgi:gamma-glutamylputrescine oxidase